MRAAWRGWALGAGAWAAVTLVVAAVAHGSNLSQARPDRPPPAFGRVLVVQALSFGAWALLAPLVARLADRVPAARRRAAAVALLLAAAPAFVAAQNAMLIGARLLAFPFPGPPLPPLRRFLALSGAEALLDLLVYATLAVGAIAAAYQREGRDRALRASRLEARLASVELEVLRMQLQPHFLFNTLHGVSSLMEHDVPAARRMLARLSELLRLSLAGDGAQLVPLADELDFLERYLEIQRLRFGDRLTAVVDADPDALAVPVPRLVLQPLVENAIRHGIASRAALGEVRVTASVRGDRLALRVEDDGVGLDGDAGREGIGLANTRARLEALYAGRARLSLRPRLGGGAEAELDLPLAPAGAGAPA